jgi:hypothetical protein
LAAHRSNDREAGLRRLLSNVQALTASTCAVR